MLATDLGALDWEYLKAVRENYPNIVIILHFFGGEKMDEYTQKAIKYRLPVINNMQFIFRALSMMWKNHRFF